MKPLCVDCQVPVNPNHADVLREVTGFAKHRDAGGQNHVLFRRETGRFMCPTCATRLKYSGRSGQQVLA